MKKQGQKKKTSLISKLFMILCFSCVFMIYVYPSIVPDPEFDDSFMRTIQWEKIPEDQNGLVSLEKATECAGGKRILEDADNFLTSNQETGLRTFSGDSTRYLECKHFIEEAVDKPFLQISSDSHEMPSLDTPIPSAKQISRLIRILIAIESENRSNHPSAESRNNLVRYLELGHRLQEAQIGPMYFGHGLTVKIDALREIANNFESGFFTAEDIERIAETIPRFRSPDNALEEALKIDYIKGREEMDESGGDLFEQYRGENNKYPSWYISFINKRLYKPNRVKRMIFRNSEKLISNIGRPYNEMVFIENYSQSTSSFLWLYLNGEIAGAMVIPTVDGIWQTVFKRHTRFNALLDMIGLKTAIYKYRNDNNRFPKNLDALIPQYIFEIPGDPFNGRKLLFDSERGVIYSVGENGIDDGRCGPMLGIMPDFNEYDYESDLCLLVTSGDSL